MIKEFYGDKGILLEIDNRVQCHLCGKWFKQLGMHITRTEGMSVDQYKEKFGLARGNGLMGSETLHKRGVAASHLREYSHLGAAVLRSRKGQRVEGKKQRAETLMNESYQQRRLQSLRKAWAAIREAALPNHPPVTCTHCSSIFRWTRSQQWNKSQRLFCSFKCYCDYRKGGGLPEVK